MMFRSSSFIRAIIIGLLVSLLSINAAIAQHQPINRGGAFTGDSANITGGTQHQQEVASEDFIYSGHRQDQVLIGGEYQRFRNSVANDQRHIDSLDKSMNDTMLSTLFNVLSLSDPMSLAGNHTMLTVSNHIAEGERTREQNYITNLYQTRQYDKITAYHACKSRKLAEGEVETDFQAIALCLGTQSIEPVESTGTDESQIAQVGDHYSRNYPFPKQEEDNERAGNVDYSQGTQECNPESEEIMCHVWSGFRMMYVDHKPALRNQRPELWIKDLWNRIDEFRRYFGDILYVSIPPQALEKIDPSELESLEEIGGSLVGAKVESPQPVYVRFKSFTDNEDLVMNLAGFEVLFAQRLQDAYGSINAVLFKVCEWNNKIEEWARAPDGSGYQKGCPLWDLPISVQFSSIACGVKTSYETSHGSYIFEPEGDVADEEMWPDQATAVGWSGGRFYELFQSQAVGTSHIPTIDRVVKRLSLGSARLQQSDIMKLWAIAKSELEAEQALSGEETTDGQYDCGKLIEGYALADILDVQDEPNPTGHFSGAREVIIDGADWPLNPTLRSASSDDPEKVVSRRITIMYDIARYVAFIQTHYAYNEFIKEVESAQVAWQRWPDKMNAIRNRIKGGLGGNSQVQIQKYGLKLEEAVAEIHSYKESLKSQARLAGVTNSAGTAGAGRSGL